MKEAADRPARTPYWRTRRGRMLENGLLLEPLDISDLYAVEVDFAEDLERANQFV